MVSDKPSLIVGEQMTVGRLFIKLFSYMSGRAGGCDEFGCDTNHNETMVSDAEPIEVAQNFEYLATAKQTAATGILLFARFFSYQRGGGCDEFGCGMNHNETLLSDVAR
jgi:hypothetical protein